MEQFLVKVLQMVRAVMHSVRRLPERVQGLLQRLTAQQAAPLRPEAVQLGVDLIELGGAGVRVQQSGGLELADVIAALHGLGNGFVQF